MLVEREVGGETLQYVYDTGYSRRTFPYLGYLDFRTNDSGKLQAIEIIETQLN